MIVKFCSLILFSSFALAAHAGPLAPVLVLGYEGGGDVIARVHFTDGSNSEIKAGNGILFAAGVIYDFTQTQPDKFELQGTLGFKFQSTKQAENGEINWYRYPIEVLSFYHNMDKHFRAGAGVTYHIGNKLDGTKDASVISATAGNALGFVAEGDYFFGKDYNMAFGLRYTVIKYKANDVSANGNSLGVDFIYAWW